MHLLKAENSYVLASRIDSLVLTQETVAMMSSARKGHVDDVVR